MSLRVLPLLAPEMREQELFSSTSMLLGQLFHGAVRTDTLH